MKKTKMLLLVGGRSTVNGEQNILKNERNRNSPNEISLLETKRNQVKKDLINKNCFSHF